MRATSLGRGVWRAVLIAFVFGGLWAASAAAKTVTVGQLFTPTFGCGNDTFLQTGVASGPSYTVPKAGVITSWSFQDAAAMVPQLKLKVGKSAGSGMYTIVADATAGTQVVNSVNTYTADIPVKAGDLIGIYYDGGFCGTSTGNALDTYVIDHANDVPPKTTAAFAGPFTGFKVPVSVKVALDCVVPNLKGKTLKAAKKALKKASCTLGTVKGPRTGTVKSQKPAAGKRLAPGAKVNIRLG